jgi:excinuclease ABC subunit B
LIQTIGRAARNIHGTAILYADNMTGSMRRAMDETERRRSRQVLYNQEHGIEPATIVKQVADIMEAAYPAPRKGRRQLDESAPRYETMTPVQLMKIAAKLEKRMLQHARDLEFEEAAGLRDEIQRLRREGLGLTDRLAG